MDDYLKLYNVVKYRNKVLSANKILANCRLVSFDGTLFTCWVWAGWELSKPLAQKFLSTNQRQGGDQKTKIWKAKNKYIFYFLHFLIPPAHQLKFVHFFPTQPLTTYFTLQRYWAWHLPYSFPISITNSGTLPNNIVMNDDED